MAARKRMWTPEIVRERIRTSMLLRRIQNHVLGDVQMTDTQLAAAKFLVERVVPKAESVRQVQHSGTITLEQLIAGELDSDEQSIPASSRPN